LRSGRRPADGPKGGWMIEVRPQAGRRPEGRMDD
jgi:hypothetical protein